jgi:3-hydroxyacyl-CoA dehydrogenase
MQTLKRMGKMAVLAKPDGVASRMMTARQAAAEAAVVQGAASPAQVDAVLYAFGFPEGVFAWEDRMGLDVSWIATGGEGDVLRARLAASGRQGRKSGGGFFDYDAAGKPVAAAAADALLAGFLKERSVTTERLDDAALLQRLLFPVVNESVGMLEEGLVARASDLDLMCVKAFGWPPYRGGPAYYGEELAGLKAVAQGLRALQARFGDAYAPCALLERLAAEGKGFADL